jgi:hypothetical protein
MAITHGAPHYARLLQSWASRRARLQGEVFRLEDTQVNKAEVCDRLDLITCRSLITAASPDAPINGTTRAGASLETACPKTAIFV